METKLTKDHIIEGSVIPDGSVVVIGEAVEKKERKANRGRKSEAKKPVEKKLEESDNLSFAIVYVNAMDSAVVYLNERNADDIKAIRDKAYKMLLASDPNASDDFWIDDVWNESGIDVDVDWKDILAPGGVLNEDMVDYVFDNPEEFGIKMQFYLDQGNNINPKTIDTDLEDIMIYDAGSERWVEGNYGTRVPEGWLENHVEENGWMTGIVEDNYGYFEEGFARVVSDYEPNGEMIMDKIGDYFVYMRL